MQGRKKLTSQVRAKRSAKREKNAGRVEAEAREVLAKSARVEAEAREMLASILKQDRKRKHHVVWRHYLVFRCAGRCSRAAAAGRRPRRA